MRLTLLRIALCGLLGAAFYAVALGLITSDRHIAAAIGAGLGAFVGMAAVNYWERRRG